MPRDADGHGAMHHSRPSTGPAPRSDGHRPRIPPPQASHARNRPDSASDSRRGSSCHGGAPGGSVCSRCCAGRECSPPPVPGPESGKDGTSSGSATPSASRRGVLPFADVNGGGCWMSGLCAASEISAFSQVAICWGPSGSRKRTSRRLDGLGD